VNQVLNCIWVLLSLWAFVQWLALSSRGRSARRLGLCGLICALTLLFPVISDNDDLLQQEVLSTPVSPIVKSLSKVKAACESCTVTGGPSCCMPFPSPAVQKFIATEPAIFISALSLGATGDRSPPRLS
jgi:hypothetical protein